MVGLPYAARQALQNLDRTIGEKPRGRHSNHGIFGHPKGQAKDYKSLRRARFEGLTIGLE